MRIAQIAPLAESVPPKLYGGTERVVHNLTEELVRQGHRVRVVTLRRSYAAPRYQLLEGVEVVRLGILGPLFAGLLRLKDRLRSNRSARALSAPAASDGSARKVRYWHPTLMLLRTDKLLFMAAAALHLGRIRREIRLIHCHESHWMAGFAGWIGRRLARPVLVKEATFPVLLPLEVRVLPTRMIPFQSVLPLRVSEPVTMKMPRSLPGNLPA